MPDAVGIPSVISLTQQGAYVKLVIAPPAQVPGTPINTVRLYKSSAATGKPWTLVTAQRLSDVSLQTWLYDPNPAYGILTFYAATAVNSTAESAMTAPVSISPRRS